MRKNDFNQFIVSSITTCVLLGILVFIPSKEESCLSIWIFCLGAIMILTTMFFAFYSICKSRGEESEEIKRKRAELAIKKEWEKFLLENYKERENLNKEKDEKKAEQERLKLEFEQIMALMKEYKKTDDQSIEAEIKELKEKVQKLEEQKAIFIEISKKKD